MRCGIHHTWHCTSTRCLHWYSNQGYSWYGMPAVDVAYNAIDGGVDLVVGEVEIAPGVEIGYDVSTGEQVLEVGGMIVDEW